MWTKLRLLSKPDDEDFYPHWEIPEELPEDMDTSQASITIRSFGDRFVSLFILYFSLLSIALDFVLLFSCIHL